MARIGSWIPLRADLQGANISILPWSARPDISKWSSATVVYELKDIWTTINGSWDYMGRFGIDQWARDTWLGKCNQGGGDHNIVVNCINAQGSFMTGKGMMFQSGDPAAIDARINDLASWTKFNIPGGLDWPAVDLFSSSTYFPDQGKQGPWLIMPYGLSDVVCGVGMPYQQHISTFCVWEEKPRSVVVSPSEPPVSPSAPPVVYDLSEVIAALDRINATLREGFHLTP